MSIEVLNEQIFVIVTVKLQNPSLNVISHCVFIHNQRFCQRVSESTFGTFCFSCYFGLAFKEVTTARGNDLKASKKGYVSQMFTLSLSVSEGVLFCVWVF